MGAVGAALGLALILQGIAIATASSGDTNAALGLIGLSFIPIVFEVVVVMVLFYRMWAAIQDGHARTSPGKAVGFLFIPLYNLYWVFVAIWGFAKDYNAYIQRHSINAAPLPEAFFLWYIIIQLIISIVARVVGGGVALLLSVIGFVLIMILVAKICDGVNALPETAGAAQ